MESNLYTELKQSKKLSDYRKQIRQGHYNGHTVGLFPEKAQFNVVILSEKFSNDFKQFCQSNKAPCPLIFQGNPGQYSFPELSEDSDSHKAIDIRIDIPAYHIYRQGNLYEERKDIMDLWQNDLTVFLIGCSFTFEYPLIKNGIRLKHVEKKKNVSMYKTNIPLHSSTHFSGNMVVSMRWIRPDQVREAESISGGYPDYHGGPIHIGEPEKIGIHHIEKPDYGEYVEPDQGDVPVFWGCGVTPQNSIQATKLPLVITHKPGSMLISGLSHEEVLAKTKK